MKTCTIKSVISSIWTGLGVDPTTVTIADAQNIRLVSSVSDLLREAWESEFFPSIMLVEQRTLDTNKSIAFAAAGLTEIGAIDPLRSVSELDPRYNKNPKLLSPCIVEGDALIVQDDAVEATTGTVWIRFRPVCPEFGMTAWSGATTYAIGDLAYLDATGHTYKSITAANLNHNPTSDTTNWQLIGFPDMFRGYIKLAAIATRLTEDEGRSKQMAEARKELDRLQDVRIGQQDHRSRRVIFSPSGPRK